MKKLPALIAFLALLLAQAGAVAVQCACAEPANMACCCKGPMKGCCKSDNSCKKPFAEPQPDLASLVASAELVMTAPLPSATTEVASTPEIRPAPVLKTRPPRIRTPDLTTESLRAPPTLA